MILALLEVSKRLMMVVVSTYIRKRSPIGSAHSRLEDRAGGGHFLGMSLLDNIELLRLFSAKSSTILPSITGQLDAFFLSSLHASSLTLSKA